MRELRIDGTLILAVDHGYGNIKTANTVFSNGFVERDTEPVMSTDYLYYGGKYYVLDQGHKNYTKDKVVDNDFYILTIAAIAKELYSRNIRCEKVHLAVGVPLKWMDSQKESFKEYMLQNSEITFVYKGRIFEVEIEGCSVMPQCYAAVAENLPDFKGLNMIVDIGNGTMNALILQDGRPIENKMWTELFGVIGEDEQGELVELDAEKVLTIPRKIRSVEVVKRGFMSNFLFQNISNIFGAPKEVIDIITSFEPVDEPKSKVNLTDEVQKDLSLDENGEVALTDEYVIGRTQDVFGDKIYDLTVQVQDTMLQIERTPDSSQKAIDKLKEAVKQGAVKAVVETAQFNYGSDMKAADKKQIESKLNHEADRLIDKLHTNYEIERNILEQHRVAEQQTRFESGKSSEEIDKEFEQKQKEIMEKFNEELTTAIQDFAKESTKETVKTVETKKKEREKETIEDGVRDHLRGFSRTIPSFLMAYGDNSVTLATFDTIVPDKVFLEVTSITLDQFKFLRDGGDYIEEETGQIKHFDGQLFDPIVFDDSVKEFLALKKKLADYFDEKSVEDIFDYIPPQKTNQIFTPKVMVKKMVDMLEQENPGCFDMPDKTFIDLYMKSGLYIAEIVKRLYQSEEMKKQFPDSKERLTHIFEKQVYGLAPTEIIYKIATSYILGFDAMSFR